MPEAKSADVRIKELEKLLREERVTTTRLQELVERLQNELEDCRPQGEMGDKVSRRESAQSLTSSGRRTFLSKIGSKTSVKGFSAGKKRGVMAPRPSENTAVSFKVTLVQKDDETKTLLRSALNANRLLGSLEASQLQDIIDAMVERKLEAGENVIQEGDDGEYLYVSSSGCYEVSINGEVLKTFGKGTAFGELALLYGCQRTATVKALERSGDSDKHIVWCLPRMSFQMITMRTGVLRHRQRLQFVKSLPIFSNLKEEYFISLVDDLSEERYAAGEYVMCQGSIGESFYIVQDGTFRVMRRDGEHGEKQINQLKTGDTFGEKALDGDDVRTASVIAETESSVLCLHRDAYTQLFSSTQSLPYAYNQESSPSSTVSQENLPLQQCELSDLIVLGRLGAGGFGRVDLVKLPATKDVFALKCMSKKDIVSKKQQAHVFSERDLQSSINHPLIVRLFRTFRDTRFVYMLLEPCLGGELWCVLRQCGRLTEKEARFAVGCVVEAIGYLHRRHIVFRDLKPGNIMLDAKGYCKLVDFGFAKHIPNSVDKTWTFCGTPEYMTPEVILNQGHTFPVDYWAIGILIFELVSGWPPFSAREPLQIYNMILKGFEGRQFPAVDFPPKAKKLLLALCRQKPSERLGNGSRGLDAIRRSPWFGNFDWVGLREQSMEPPIVPQLKSNEDLSNFDQSHAAAPIKQPPEDISGWDEGF